MFSIVPERISGWTRVWVRLGVRRGSASKRAMIRSQTAAGMASGNASMKCAMVPCPCDASAWNSSAFVAWRKRYEVLYLTVKQYLTDRYI